MRLIDADALMKEFRDFVRESNNSDFAPVPNWNDAVSLVGSAPTVNTDLSDYSDRLWQAAYERGKAEARKKGKWIKLVAHHRYYNTERTVCSECGGEPFEWDDSGEWLSEYCPHCGAEMRKETEDAEIH